MTNEQEKIIEKALSMSLDRLSKIRSRLSTEEQYEWCPEYTDEEEEEMDFLENLTDVLYGNGLE